MNSRTVDRWMEFLTYKSGVMNIGMGEGSGECVCGDGGGGGGLIWVRSKSGSLTRLISSSSGPASVRSFPACVSAMERKEK